MDSENPTVYQRLAVSDSVLFSREAPEPSIDESESRFPRPHFPMHYPLLLGEKGKREFEEKTMGIGYTSRKASGVGKVCEKWVLFLVSPICASYIEENVR